MQHLIYISVSNCDVKLLLWSVDISSGIPYFEKKLDEFLDC